MQKKSGIIVLERIRNFIVHQVSKGLVCLARCKESDAHSLRGGGDELGKLKTLTYDFTTFA
jgi:hypothetical protein